MSSNLFQAKYKIKSKKVILSNNVFKCYIDPTIFIYFINYNLWENLILLYRYILKLVTTLMGMGWLNIL